MNTVIGSNSQADARPRADIAVLGYHQTTVTSALSGSLATREFASLPDLQQNPARVETRAKQELDGTGHVTAIPVPFPVWVEPVATGGTPMLKALQRARELAKGWASAHPESYPPIILKSDQWGGNG